jgi:hypothetical protein
MRVPNVLRLGRVAAKVAGNEASDASFGQRVDDLRLLGEARMTEMMPPWPLILWNELLL